MKQLFYKLLAIPFVAFFVAMITVAIMGSFLDNRWMKEHLDNSALPVWLAWVAILFITTVTHHFFKKEKAE